MTGGAAGGLDEAGGAAEVALLVGIEDGDEGDFGEVEAFAEEVDTDEDIELSLSEGAEDFDTFDGVDFAMQVADVDAEVAEVVGEFFGGAFGEGGDEDSFVFIDVLADGLDEVIDLAFEWADGDGGVDEAGGADDEFGDALFGPFEFAVAWGSADVYGRALE
ncbi:MAG: hypothetical protein RI897_2687 [Verrucomicrobiota bacterium]